MKLVNSLGRVLKIMKGNVDSLNMSIYPKGFYFLTIQTENDEVVKKIIKL